MAKPAIDLDALGVITDDLPFLALARAFEDVGVSAYGGAARFIQNKDYLEAAARILATEAYHAGNIRLIVALKSRPASGADGHPRVVGAVSQPPRRLYGRMRSGVVILIRPHAGHSARPRHRRRSEDDSWSRHSLI